MSDPHEPGGISVTIKADEPGGKYNDAKSPGSWVVFHGSVEKIREQIIEFFELDVEATKGRPLYDLVNEATALFKAAANASRTLGARVATEAGVSTPSTSGDVWEQAAAAQREQGGQGDKPEEPEADPILAALELCQSVADVQQVWAENQQAFNDNPAYMDAYKARGRALAGK